MRNQPPLNNSFGWPSYSNMMHEFKEFHEKWPQKLFVNVHFPVRQFIWCSKLYIRHQQWWIMCPTA